MNREELAAEVEPFEQPTDAGRRLDVGAFVLADAFEVLLRQISADYLGQTWNRVQRVLEENDIAADDLSLGWLHPSEAWAPQVPVEASSFTGWTSRRLVRFDLDARWSAIDRQLRAGAPALRCAVSWRSRKWSIQASDGIRAERLIEYLWTDESSEWDPAALLRAHPEVPDVDEPWLAVARAIRDEDESGLERAMGNASARYSPLGYRIIERGFGLI